MEWEEEKVCQRKGQGCVTTDSEDQGYGGREGANLVGGPPRRNRRTVE